MSVVEDEVHFVLECPQYSDLRADLKHILNKTNIQLLDTNNKFIWLLTNEDKDICKKLALFIHRSFHTRRELLSHTNSQTTDITLNPQSASNI